MLEIIEIEKLLKIIGFKEKRKYSKHFHFGIRFEINKKWKYKKYVFIYHKLDMTRCAYLEISDERIFTLNSYMDVCIIIEIIKLLKEHFKSEIRKYKIKNIII